MGSEVGASAGVVAKWWQRGFIPPEYWPALVATDKARENGVTLELLAGLALQRAEVAKARKLDEARA